MSRALDFDGRGGFGEYRALLARPGYRGFSSTVLLARVGGAMFNTGGVVLVLERTGRPEVAGLTASAGLLAGAVAGPVLGAWLDVATRRRVLIVIDQALSVVALALLVTLAGHVPNWLLPLVGIVYGLTRTFSTGTFFSALAEIAGPELLDQAASIDASTMNLSLVLGPAVAGAIAGVATPAVAIEIQIVVAGMVAILVAANPAFEARSPQRATRTLIALRSGIRAFRRNSGLRMLGLLGMLANFSWGLMIVGFPLYAAQHLHAHANASGYLWAALALGSIAGTFLIPGTVSWRRIGISYGILGVSALLWLLAGNVLAAAALVLLTGVLEGPAYSGSAALRQRLAPPRLRAQVSSTIMSLTALAISAGGIVAATVKHPVLLIIVFASVNALAAICAATQGAKSVDASRGAVSI